MKQAKSHPVGWGPVASIGMRLAPGLRLDGFYGKMTFFFGGKCLKVYTQYCSDGWENSAN